MRTFIYMYTHSHTRSNTLTHAASRVSVLNRPPSPAHRAAASHRAHPARVFLPHSSLLAHHRSSQGPTIQAPGPSYVLDLVIIVIVVQHDHIRRAYCDPHVAVDDDLEEVQASDDHPCVACLLQADAYSLLHCRDLPVRGLELDREPGLTFRTDVVDEEVGPACQRAGLLLQVASQLPPPALASVSLPRVAVADDVRVVVVEPGDAFASSRRLLQKRFFSLLQPSGAEGDCRSFISLIATQSPPDDSSAIFLIFC